MAGKKNSIETKKAALKKAVSAKDITAHPFETDSQIENRYGKGREKNGSDGRGTNH